MGADDRTHDQADDHAHDPIRRAAQYRVDREAAKGAGRTVEPGEPTGRAGAEGASEQADTSRRRMDDRASSEQRVREMVEEFNARVIDARRQLMGGPPVVTPTRDVDREVGSWHQRRSARNPRPADLRPTDA